MKLIRWINASAGAGKTHTVKELLTNLVQSGANPRSILCLTFTTAGAMEMKHRYLQENGSDSNTPQFETIHSFAKTLVGDEWNVISELEAKNLMQEAIEFVLLDPVWYSFFESISSIWVNIVQDIKNIIASGLPLKDSFLEKYMLKAYAQNKVTLSKRAVDALTAASLEILVSKLQSNDISTYSEFVTKEHKLNKRILPASFVANPLNAEVLEELENVFDMIHKSVIEFQNTDYLRQSVSCNLFIREVSMAYQKLKANNKLIDFNDMLYTALHKIRVSSEPIMHFRHIFLDEAQDTSEVQWKLIYRMAMEIFQLDDVSFTIVGDHKQIIYQFNGASKPLYFKMKNKFRNLAKELSGTWDEVELDRSYRSSQVLLNFIDSIMTGTACDSKHTAAYDKLGYIKTWLPLNNVSSDTVPHRGWTIPKEQNILPWVLVCVDEIKNMIGKKKLLNEDRFIEPDDIAILVPRRCVHNFILTERLKAAGIPIKETLFGMVMDETVQDLLSIGSLSIDIKNDVMLANMLKNLYFGWTNTELEDLLINREDGVWNTLVNTDTPKAQRLVNAAKEWLSFPTDLVSFYSKVIFHSEFGKCMLQNFRSETTAFWEKVIGLSRLSLSEFISHMQSAYEPMKLNRKGITISTTHSSKGKEFQIIFVSNPHLSLSKVTINQIIYNNMLLLKGNYELYKNLKNKNSLDQENESDRLLYVALTRAKEQLYILPPMSSDNLNPKSWYARVLRSIDLFTENGDFYEITSPVSQKTKLKA